VNHLKGGVDGAVRPGLTRVHVSKQ
jgi:hypothetical protein